MVDHSPPTPPPSPRIPRRLQSFLVFWWRLLLLGVGGSLAALIGVAIAQIYPAKPAPVPASEILLRQTASWLRQARSLPLFGSQPPPAPADDFSQVPPIAPPIADSPPPAEIAPPLEIPDLTLDQQATLQGELETLQTDFTQLGDRAATLEEAIGAARSELPLGDRLQILDQQLNPADPAATPTPETNPEPTPAPEPIAPPPSPSSSLPPAPQPDPAIAPFRYLQVTLPSDVLFAPNSTQLRAETTVILDSVLPELQRYPQATLQIAGHMDNQIGAAEGRTLSWQQARAVQQYLAAALGDRQRIVIVGYGQQRPLVPNDTSFNRQQNRRIELFVYPQ